MMDPEGLPTSQKDQTVELVRKISRTASDANPEGAFGLVRPDLHRFERIANIQDNEASIVRGDVRQMADDLHSVRGAAGQKIGNPNRLGGIRYIDDVEPCFTHRHVGECAGDLYPGGIVGGCQHAQKFGRLGISHIPYLETCRPASDVGNLVSHENSDRGTPCCKRAKLHRVRGVTDVDDLQSSIAVGHVSPVAHHV